MEIYIMFCFLSDPFSIVLFWVLFKVIEHFSFLLVFYVVFYSFNVSQNSSTHFTRTNYGYLNSTIMFVMVTASINVNDWLWKHRSTPKSKNLRANRGKPKVPGSILFCMNQTIEYTCVLLLWLWRDPYSWLVQCPSPGGDVCYGQVN